MKKRLYAVLAFSIALAVRLYPTFLSGLPFSTDAWSPIRNAELLMEYTPINLDSKAFDGYNCYWPANSLFGAVFSYATGLKPIDAMAIGIPLTGALAVLILYTLMVKIGQSCELAFFASIIMATIYPYALFTAGVTKETYANPLYLAVILLFVGRVKWREALIFAVVSVALVMAHHLTALIAIAVLASIALANSIVRARRGLSFDRAGVLLASAVAAITALYFGLYAYKGLKLTLTVGDWISAGSYQIIAFAVALYFASKPMKQRSPARTALICTAVAASASVFTFLCTKTSITSGAPTLPSHYMLYASPFIIASPLMVLGFGELSRMGGEHHTVPLFWLAAILGLEGYAVFGDSLLGLTLAYRALNFLCVPLAILCAAGLHRLCSAPGKTRRLARVTAAASLITITALGCFSVYAAVSLQERYMGYFWLYRPSDYMSAAWLAAASNQAVAADVKFAYLLRDYFNVSVDAYQGLKYLTGGGVKPQLLLVYDQMVKNGYVIYGGYSVDLPERWREKLNSLNLVYSNEHVNIHCG